MYKLQTKNKLQVKQTRPRPMSSTLIMYMQNDETEHSHYSRSQTRISDPSVIERIKRMSYTEILS
jgi:hypothetical protein